MLHAVHFHRNRRRGHLSYKKKDKPFQLVYVQDDRVPQQRIGYDCLKFIFLFMVLLFSSIVMVVSCGQLQGKLWSPYFEDD